MFHDPVLVSARPLSRAPPDLVLLPQGRLQAAPSRRTSGTRLELQRRTFPRSAIRRDGGGLVLSKDWGARLCASASGLARSLRSLGLGFLGAWPFRCEDPRFRGLDS